MDDKIVIICATGRSGSTTMLRLLNTIPNSNICGENNGAIISLLEFYKNIKYTTVTKTMQTYNSATLDQIVNERRMSPSWYNSYNYNGIVNSIRSMIINLFKNKKETTLWGCKEIRFFNGKVELLKELKELFPQVKIILHVRKDIASQAKSQLNAWTPKDKQTIKQIESQNNELFKFSQAHKDYCYFSTFEEMFNLVKLRAIFDFICCEEHFNKYKIKKILSDNLH
jgi:hypothetical protein